MKENEKIKAWRKRHYSYWKKRGLDDESILALQEGIEHNSFKCDICGDFANFDVFGKKYLSDFMGGIFFCESCYKQKYPPHSFFCNCEKVVDR